MGTKIPGRSDIIDAVDTLDDTRDLIWAILVLAAELATTAHIHAVAAAAHEKLKKVRLLLDGPSSEA